MAGICSRQRVDTESRAKKIKIYFHKEVFGKNGDSYYMMQCDWVERHQPDISTLRFEEFGKKKLQIEKKGSGKSGYKSHRIIKYAVMQTL